MKATIRSQEKVKSTMRLHDKAQKDKNLTVIMKGMQLNLMQIEEQLKNIYWTEEALTKAIPRMIQHTPSDELVKVLEFHLAQTQAIIQQTERCLYYLTKNRLSLSARDWRSV